jgi:hypothetical protein
MALDYWRAWDRLPAQLAVHFDASLHPNRWAPRGDFVAQALGITVASLVAFTLGALYARSRKPSSFWPVVILFGFVLALQWWMNHSVIRHNLG